MHQPPFFNSVQAVRGKNKQGFVGGILNVKERREELRFVRKMKRGIILSFNQRL